MAADALRLDPHPRARSVTPLAPDVLLLGEDEWFRDEDGNAISIEVRGERRHDACWFSVKDVSKGFDLLNLTDSFALKTSGDGHFVYFPSLSELFVSYSGLIRCLFDSRSPSAIAFQEWALRILFVHSMGSEEQRTRVAGLCLGVSPHELRRVLSRSAEPISCVYVLSIGRVGDLRDALGIGAVYGDDDTVVKFGRTFDLLRRTRDLEKHFGAIENARLEIMHFLYVDPDCCEEAEAMLIDYFKDSIVSSKNVAVLDKPSLRRVGDRFTSIRDRCSQQARSLNDHIRALQKDLTHSAAMSRMLTQHAAETRAGAERADDDRVQQQTLVAQNQAAMAQVAEQFQVSLRLMEEKHRLELASLRMQIDMMTRIHDLELQRKNEEAL